MATYKRKNEVDELADDIKALEKWLIEFFEDAERAQKPEPDVVKAVYFNYEKGATTVVWFDGMRTTVSCQNGEDFDEEKAIALCFMKRVFDNKGLFNNYMRKYLDGAQVISKKKKNKKTKRNWITK